MPPTGVIFNDVDYAEHARRRYSDPIQYAARASIITKTQV